jgi:hypothetical protein
MSAHIRIVTQIRPYTRIYPRMYALTPHICAFALTPRRRQLLQAHLSFTVSVLLGPPVCNDASVRQDSRLRLFNRELTPRHRVEMPPAVSNCRSAGGIVWRRCCCRCCRVRPTTRLRACGKPARTIFLLVQAASLRPSMAPTSVEIARAEIRYPGRCPSSSSRRSLQSGHELNRAGRSTTLQSGLPHHAARLKAPRRRPSC